MKLSRMLKTLTFLFLFQSSAGFANIYNHGNHVDPMVFPIYDAAENFACGSMSLSECTSIYGTLKFRADQLCNNALYVSPPHQYGTPYFHSIQGFGIQITNTSYSAGQYHVEFFYDCSALRHPGRRMPQLAM